MINRYDEFMILEGMKQEAEKSGILPFGAPYDLSSPSPEDVGILRVVVSVDLTRHSASGQSSVQSQAMESEMPPKDATAAVNLRMVRKVKQGQREVKLFGDDVE